MFRRMILLAALVLPVMSVLVAQQPPAATQPTGEKLAPYYPTPESIVDRMLQLAELKAGDFAASFAQMDHFHSDPAQRLRKARFAGHRRQGGRHRGKKESVVHDSDSGVADSAARQHGTSAAGLRTGIGAGAGRGILCGLLVGQSGAPPSDQNRAYHRRHCQRARIAGPGARAR